MDTIRAFIAFPIPDEVREKLGGAQKAISKNIPNLRPVKPQGIHLTLSFLGDITQGQVYQVSQVMQQVCDKHKPMEFICRGFGGFPDLKSPRVLWAGLQGDIAPLQSFHRELVTELAKLGFPMEERPFTPHLTLFRIKGKQKQLGTIRKRMDVASRENVGIVPCDTLVLFRTDLKPDGAVYSKLKIVALD